MVLVALAVFVGHVTQTAQKRAINGKCVPLKGYDKVDLSGGMCHYTQVTQLGGLLYAALIVLVATLALAYFTRRKRRSGVVFVSFGLFFILSWLSSIVGIFYIVGLVFMGGAGWLMIRAWRLQRHGVATAREVTRVTREKAQNKSSSKKAAAVSDADASPAARRPAEPSKRYTPKKPPPKKRR